MKTVKIAMPKELNEIKALAKSLSTDENVYCMTILPEEDENVAYEIGRKIRILPFGEVWSEFVKSENTDELISELAIGECKLLRYDYEMD